MTSTAPLLQLSSIGKQFGGLSALSDVSLHIRRGEIYGLIGPNGAGKTTLFNVITGLYQPGAGEFQFNGARYQACKPHVLAQAGIARTFQNIRLFANLTALENVMIGRHLRTRAGVFGALLRNRATRDEERAITERARELLRYVGIDKPAQTLAKHLSYGEQRRLEIARTLATDPLLLALDEPAAGMNATETASLKTLLQTIRTSGIRAADRARRQTHHGAVRPRRGTRLRQEDRRRRAGTSAQRSCRDRRVSGSGGNTNLPSPAGGGLGRG